MVIDTTAARTRAQRGEVLRAVSGNAIFGPAAQISDQRKSLVRGLADSLVREVSEVLRTAMAGHAPASEMHRSFTAIPVNALSARLGELPVFRTPAMLGLLFRHADDHLFHQRLATGVSPMAGPIGRMAQAADPAMAQNAMALVIAMARRSDAAGTPVLVMDEVPGPELEQVVWQVAATFGSLSPVVDRDPALPRAARALLSDHMPARAVGERAAILATSIERAGWGRDDLMIELITSGALQVAAALLAIRCNLRHTDCLDILISDEPLCWAVLATGASMPGAHLFAQLAAGQGRAAAAIEAEAHVARLGTTERDDILRDWRLDPVYRAARAAIRS